MRDFESESVELVSELTKIMEQIKIAKQLKNSKQVKSLNKELKKKNKELNELQSKKIMEQLYQEQNKSQKQSVVPE